MSSSSSSSSSGSGSNRSNAPTRPLDPISRTALRYTLSPREYELLHQYLISRAPKQVQRQTPSPKRFEKLTGQKRPSTRQSASISSGSEGLDSNVEALRAALRAFVAVYVGFKGYGILTRKLAERRGKKTPPQLRFGNARVALSFSTILLFHKLLHRFFRRLRTSLLEDNAAPFRRRNPKVAQLLTSQCTPVIGAALSGFALGLSPADQLRMTIAIYVFTRSLEFGYNALEEGGYLWKSEEEGGKGKPWWFGSWMLMPFACGQLLHAFVFDRECFPAAYGDFIIKRSPEYIQSRPPQLPKDAPWPNTFAIVDTLAAISKLNWPPFISPILFPATKDALPNQLASVASVTSPAHPATLHTSCALLHPSDPSCLRTYLKYYISVFPGLVRFFTLLYGAFSLLGYKAFLKDPLAFLNRLSQRILRMALFVAGAIGTSWASICFFNIYLSRVFLPTQRWFLGGFVGGLWAFVARAKERGTFMYSARLSIDSLWKVGRKRGWWKGIAGGDVLLFVASLALMDFTYEVRPGAVRGAMIRKSLGVMRGEGFIDRAQDPSSKEAERQASVDEKEKDE